MIGETLLIFHHYVQYIKVEALPSKKKKSENSIERIKLVSFSFFLFLGNID